MRHLTLSFLLLALAAVCCTPAWAQSDPDGNLAVTATVLPQVSVLGEPLRIQATVTNVGNEPATFGHDGCPVWYTIDETFDPPWGCAEFWRLVTLEPGDSITFPAPEESLDVIVHTADLYPLGPGEHLFDIRVGDAGATRLTVEVQYPDVPLSFVGGRVFGSDAHAPAGIPVYLNPQGEVAADAVIYIAYTGAAGYFFFDGVPHGDYLLSAVSGGIQTWYPGTNDPNQAQTLRLLGWRGDLELPLQNDPLPGGHFVGRVFEMGPDGSQTPLADAYVTAIPVGLDAYSEDTGGFGPLPGPVTAFTGEDGSFVLRAEGGSYKLFAGRFPGYDYVYADQAATWPQAPIVNPYWRRTYSFDLEPMEADSKTTFKGQVLAYNPVTDGPPEPLEGVQVQAVPLGALPYEILQLARTDADGQYELPVFSGTPYYLAFYKDGYYEAYFGNAQGQLGAEGVDAHPGETLDHLNAILQPRGEYSLGSIRGRVLAHVRCKDDTRCEHPLAGAVVEVNPAYPTFAPDPRRAITDSAGYFLVPNLGASAEGLPYYVQAEARGYVLGFYPGGVPYWENALPLMVFPHSTSDAGDLLLRPQPDDGASIAGQVVDREGVPISDVHVMLFPYYPDPPIATDVRLAGPFHVYTDERGRFEMFGLEDDGYLLAFSNEGYVPGYLGRENTVYRWRYARTVSPLDEDARELSVTLHPQDTAGPYIQAGRVSRVTGEVELAAAPSPAEIALAYHRHNLADAFFYLVASEPAGFGEFVVAGGHTGNNGAVILTGLGEGVYYAYADRPGYETTYFSSNAGTVVPIFLGPATPAILAEIALPPLTGVPGEPPPVVHNLAHKPNPMQCGTETAITFTMEMAGEVTVDVFDTLGRRVRRVAEKAFIPGGEQVFPWDGRNEQGLPVPAGVYFTRVESHNAMQANKIVVLP